MKRNDRETTFSRRSFILAAGGGLIFTGLGARLVSLQISQTERYRTLSEDNQFNFRLLTPSRGRILDRNGEVLADNQDAYNVLMVPDQTGGVEAAIDRLSAHIEISEGQRQRILREVQRNPSFRPVTIAENLDWETFARLNVHAPDLPGILPVVGEVRYYPHGPILAHTTGYVGKASEEVAGNDPLLRHPGFRIGRDGLELSLDERLRGEAGALKVEVDAYGRVVRELPDPKTKPTPGDDIRLTLDLKLQQYAAQRMEDEAASAVAIDVRNGDILALASVPSYDPNSFAKGMSQKEYDALRADERQPLFKKAVGGLYPPASTFKLLVALAAQRHGVMDPGERVFCSGRIRLGNHPFHCWKRGGHGALDMAGAIQHSCDIYYYEAARRLGIEKIAETAREFGLGEKFDIAVPGVQSGTVPDEAWKLARFGERWQGGETLIAGIGQGYLSTSPLQLAVMTARVATGRAVTPRVVTDGSTGPFAPLNYNEGSFALVREAMMSVCEQPGGTAYYALGGGFEYGDMLMAGKSGTGQVRRISLSERATGVLKGDQVPWKYRDHALFVCFAPYEDPRYAVAVVVEHGVGGSSNAGPRARDILRACFEREAGRDPTAVAAADTPERDT